MSEAYETEQAAAQEDEQRSAPGDLETAGETTAADTIGGPQNERPVGEGTMIEVEDGPTPETGADG